jgi:hypothetical protein
LWLISSIGNSPSKVKVGEPGGGRSGRADREFAALADSDAAKAPQNRQSEKSRNPVVQGRKIQRLIFKHEQDYIVDLHAAEQERFCHRNLQTVFLSG